MTAKRCDYAEPGHRCQATATYQVTYWLNGKERRASRCGRHNTAAHLPAGVTGVESDFRAPESFGDDADAWKRGR